MIGILFHGPEVFDSGWAQRIVEAFAPMAPLCCALAGTMGRTAAMDSGLPDIRCPGTQPSRILREMQNEVDLAIFAIHAKSASSGLRHGAMVAARADIGIPLVQIECSAGLFVELNPGIHPEVMEVLQRRLGLRKHDRIKNTDSVWEDNGRICRRLTTSDAGDFVLADGIVIGRATGKEIVIECAEGRITGASGMEIKAHGLEKLEQRGGVELQSVKLATTRSLRRLQHAPRITKRAGKGMAFVDHAAERIYESVRGMEGAVTIGDDTTAIVGDILYRFEMPVIGITDGDQDVLLENTRITPGSVVFTVRQDDLAGRAVFSGIFQNRLFIDETFDAVRERIETLVQDELVRRQEF